MLVYTVRVNTPSSAHLWAYRNTPSREQVLNRVMKEEGNRRPLEWYEVHTTIEFGKTELLG